MSSEQHGEVHHPRKHNGAQQFERVIQIAMVVIVAVLAIGLIYGLVNTGGGADTPSWMR
jgi:cell division protein FtsL